VPPVASTSRRSGVTTSALARIDSSAISASSSASSLRCRRAARAGEAPPAASVGC
jgi:hypothetical protein